ncbi:hypothetical protein D3C73_1005760 [compost metagenome]
MALQQHLVNGSDHFSGSFHHMRMIKRLIRNIAIVHPALRFFRKETITPQRQVDALFVQQSKSRVPFAEPGSNA